MTAEANVVRGARQRRAACSPMRRAPADKYDDMVSKETDVKPESTRVAAPEDAHSEEVPF